MCVYHTNLVGELTVEPGPNILAKEREKRIQLCKYQISCCAKLTCQQQEQQQQ